MSQSNTIVSNVLINLDHGMEVKISVHQMAKAFWSMNTEQQADFLDALGAEIESDHITNKNAYSYGELHWCYLKDELRRHGRERANNVHMAISAFAFEFWTQKNNGAREGL